MKALAVILIAVSIAGYGSELRADELTDAFASGIKNALEQSEEGDRFRDVRDLFFIDTDDDFSVQLLDRVTDIIAGMRGHDITFEPLPADAELVHVVDGYEYRPNVEPAGRVVFTDPAAAPGNDTKVLYGHHPSEQRLVFPLTVRTLVNPNAGPDKQLQMLAMGMAHPPAVFTGWCDIALSNNTIKRITLDDQGVGNQTRIMRGQSIEACELSIADNRGTLSLRLYEDDEEIFVRRIESPEKMIVYTRPK